MTDTNDAGIAGSEPVPVGDVWSYKPGGEGPLTPREAARSLRDGRAKALAGTQAPAESAPVAPAAPPAQESAPADAAAPQEPSGETLEPEADLPPIAPPVSWTTAEKDRFASLPRETQEYLAQRETERDRDYLRKSNEVAETRKAYDARLAQAEQARQQYEGALPILLQNLQAAYSGEFSDIQSMDDVAKLAQQDPIRYTQWDAHQKRLAGVQQEIMAAQQRQSIESAQRFEAFRQKQDALFLERAPEFKDPEVRSKATTGAVELLQDLGFTREELGQLYRGEANLSLHDHRVQLLVRDGWLYREAKASTKRLPEQKKPVPPVQRPGTGTVKGSDAIQEIKTLENQLSNARGVEARRIAVKLQQARRAAAAR